MSEILYASIESKGLHSTLHISIDKPAFDLSGIRFEKNEQELLTLDAVLQFLEWNIIQKAGAEIAKERLTEIIQSCITVQVSAPQVTGICLKSIDKRLASNAISTFNEALRLSIDTIVVRVLDLRTEIVTHIDFVDWPNVSTSIDKDTEAQLFEPITMGISNVTKH